MKTCVLWSFCILTAGILSVCRGETPFEKVVLDREFRAEGCAIADINRDGKPDIVAGDSWYEAPNWKRHVFRTVGKIRSYRDLRYDYPDDVNGDGWVDIFSVRFDRNVVWFENPRGKEGRWVERKIAEFQLCEGVFYGDLDGDGKGDFVGPLHPPALCWYERTADANAPWTRREIGPRGGDRHGIGIGDVNRDGRNDLLTKEGWYEAPPDPRKGEWKFHEIRLGDCFVIYAYDVDGDGDNDLISSSPHNYGIWWWEQTTTAVEIRNGGRPKRLEKTMWLKHLIDKSFSQAHALALADLDGDGDKDLVSGKRYYAHDGHDPGAEETVVLLWFELQRDNGKVRWTRHQIDDDSGVGYQISVGDIDGDRNPDIVTSNKKGVFLFRNRLSRREARLFDRGLKPFSPVPPRD